MQFAKIKLVISGIQPEVRGNPTRGGIPTRHNSDLRAENPPQGGIIPAPGRDCDPAKLRPRAGKIPP